MNNLARIATMGRGGDTMLGHLTPGDVTIPAERIRRNPATRNALMKMLGRDLSRFTVGSMANSRNPLTGLPEFVDGGAGSGGDGGGSGGDSGGDSGGGSGGPGGETGTGHDEGASVGGPGFGGGTGSSDTSSTGNDIAGITAEVNQLGNDLWGSQPQGPSQPGEDESFDAATLGAGPLAGALGLQSPDALSQATGGLLGQDINSRFGQNMNMSDESGLSGLLGGLLSNFGLNVNATTGSFSPNSNIVGGLLGLAPGIAGLVGTGLNLTGIGPALGEAMGLNAPAGRSLGDVLGLGGLFGGGGTGTGTGGLGGPGGDNGAGGDWLSGNWTSPLNLQPPAVQPVGAPNIPLSLQPPAVKPVGAANTLQNFLRGQPAFNQNLSTAWNQNPLMRAANNIVR